MKVPKGWKKGERLLVLNDDAKHQQIFYLSREKIPEFPGKEEPIYICFNNITEVFDFLIQWHGKDKKRMSSPYKDCTNMTFKNGDNVATVDEMEFTVKYKERISNPSMRWRAIFSNGCDMPLVNIVCKQWTAIKCI